MAKRRATRGSRPGTGAFALARRFTLAPTPAAEVAGACLIEPAWDGHRMLPTRVDDDVRRAALDYRDWTQTFPSPVRALARLPARSLAVDGVVCVMDARGAPTFDGLRAEVAGGKAVTTAVLIAWDLMWLDD